MTPGAGWQPDDEFLSRVKRAYRLSIAHWAGAGRSMWSGIFNLQLPVHEALLSDDDRLRAIFADPGSTDLYYGVDNLCEFMISQTGQFELPQLGSGDETGNLLLKAAGLIAPGRDTFDGLDTALLQHIEFPNPFRGEIGVRTERGVASYRAIQGLYQAHRIHELAPGGRVIEIGPGMGRTAFYAHRAGIQYTTIDLPIGVVAQACFLGAALGPDHVWLLGDDAELQAGRIRLLPISAGLPTERFELAVNVDSMTEMDASAAAHYARWISGHAARFLSINHDVNLFTVEELTRRAFTIASAARTAYPLRDGYIEEVITPGQTLAAWQTAAAMSALTVSRRARRLLQNALDAIRDRDRAHLRT